MFDQFLTNWKNISRLGFFLNKLFLYKSLKIGLEVEKFEIVSKQLYVMDVVYIQGDS